MSSAVVDRKGLPRRTTRCSRPGPQLGPSWYLGQPAAPAAELRSLIGIGGSLAAPPLPHHRAYGSVPRRFDRIRPLMERPGEEGRASRSTRWATPVGPPGDRTCATRLWVSRLLPPPQTQPRRDFVAGQSVSALSATAATGTCAVAYVSTHRGWTAPAASGRSYSSPASRPGRQPIARSTWSGSPRVSDASVPGPVP